MAYPHKWYMPFLAPIATVFIRLIDSSVLNLTVLKGQAPNVLLFWFLHGSIHLKTPVHS